MSTGGHVAGALRPGVHTPSARMLDLIEDIARGTAALTSRWVPHRLILHNYWLYPYQEFHFAGGNLVLRGQNGAGKSTVLTTAITLALDGDKQPARLDTFRSGSKLISDYLVGPKDATPTDPMYREENTAYIAFEFRRAEQAEYCTVGLGLNAMRKSESGVPKTNSWYFVVRDGRRCGKGRDIEFSKVDGGHEIMRSTQDLETVLGSTALLTTSRDEYQHAVNQALFGFEKDGFTNLMQLLITVRSPKLNKDIMPEEACRMLSDALPPLSPTLLARMTDLIDDIENTQRTVTANTDHLRRVTELARTQESIYRSLAQETALDLIEVTDQRDHATRTLSGRQGRLADLELSGKTANEELAALKDEERTIQSSLRFIRNHELYRGHNALRAKKEQLDTALRAEFQAQRAAEHHERTVAAAVRAADDARTHWQQLRATARSTVRQADAASRDAKWQRALDASEAAGSRLTEAEPQGAPVRFEVRQLEIEAAERMQRLDAIRTVLSALTKLEDEHTRTRTVVAERATRLEEADAARGEAHRDVGTAKAGLAAQLRQWHSSLVQLRIPVPSLADALREIEAVAVGADPRAAVEEIRDEGERQQRRSADAEAEARDRLRDATRELQEQLDAVESWRSGRTRSETPDRPGQSEMRQALVDAGVTATPLYEVCAPRADADDSVIARIETALTEAGLIDALVVSPAGAERAAELAAAAPETRGDRWIVPAPAPAGPTLADYLVVEEGVVDPDLVRAVLQTVRVATDGEGAAVSPDGTWKIGALRGASMDTGHAQPRLIGDSYRQRRWAERLHEMELEAERLQTLLAEAKHEHGQRLDARRTLEAEVADLSVIPGWRTLENWLLLLAERERHQSAAREALDLATDSEQEAQARVNEKKFELNGVVQHVPEARGLDAGAVASIRRATEDARRRLCTLAIEIERLNVARARIPDADEQMVNARAALGEAEELHSRARDARLEIAADLEVAEAALDDDGLRNLLAQETTLEARLEAIPHERESKAKAIGSIERETGQVTKEIDEQAEAVRRLTQAVSAKAFAFGESLTQYPALDDWRRQFDDGDTHDLASVVLQSRAKADPATMRERIADAVRDGITRLSREFNQDGNAIVLSDYGPSMLEHGRATRLVFSNVPNEPGQHTLASLRDILQRVKEHHEKLVVEKEAAFYKEFLYGEVTNAMREAIESAESSTAHVNTLLAGRTIGDGWVLSLTWAPRTDDRAKEPTADYRPIVKLLKRAPSSLNKEEHSQIKEFFRERVEDARRPKPANRPDRGETAPRVEKTFAEALHEIFDYRRWFQYSIHTQQHSGTTHELTNARYNKNSGAEKALFIFLPLLAAADARYRDASPHAPKLLGMDEAFSGVDMANRDAALRFMADLGFCWVATSEKLWGTGPAVRASMNYGFTKRNGIASVSAILWNGRERIADAVPRLGHVVQVEASLDPTLFDDAIDVSA